MTQFARVLLLILATLSGVVTTLMVYSYVSLTADSFDMSAECEGAVDLAQCVSDAKIAMLDLSQQFNLSVGIVSLMLCLFFLYLRTKFKGKI